MTRSLAELRFCNNLTVTFWGATAPYQALLSHQGQGYFRTKLTLYSGETYQIRTIRYKKCELEVHGAGLYEQWWSGVSLGRAWHQTNCPAVSRESRDDFTCLVWPSEGMFSCKEVQFKTFLPAVKNSYPPTEIANQSSLDIFWNLSASSRCGPRC